MNILIFILIKIPRKIFRVIFYKYEYFYYRFLYPKVKLKKSFTPKQYLIYGGDDLDNLENFYHHLFPDKVRTKIAQADLICEHIFDLLGSGPKKLSLNGEDYQPIDWHSDFKSGYKWDPKIFFRNIKFSYVEGVDKKVPWELSRFQHLNILGQAYLITNDKKYLEEFVNQINDWIENNPVGFGINWKCTMDVAIRATNWLVALEYFVREDNLSKEFLYKFYSSIYEHGKFIRSHLEYYWEFTKIAANHYLSDIVGLFFISVYCPFFKESKRWLDFCVKELTKEINKQIYEDGCDFEASTSYHRLVLEMFFYCNLLADRADISLPKNFKDKLKKMFDVSLYCIKPDGMVPQVGDNDSGRFLVFANRPILEHKYLSIFASIYYTDFSFKLPSFNFDEEAFWAFGKRGKKVYYKLPSRTKCLASKAFPDAGWYIIHHDNDYCFISCGSNGQNGIGGHAHNDKLSFELMFEGKDVIVDPGTYVYASYPKDRNKFRSTEYHNTVKFDGYEQNEISEKYMFSLPDKVKIKDADLKVTDYKIIFQGEIQYLDFTHKRIITLDKKSGGWQITDSIFSLKPINAKLIIHLSPGVFYDNGFILSKKANKKIVSIEVEESSLKKNEYDYSIEYGTKMKAEYLVANIYAAKGIKAINTYIYKA